MKENGHGFQMRLCRRVPLLTGNSRNHFPRIARSILPPLFFAILFLSVMTSAFVSVVSANPPSLNITSADGGVLITWPASFWDYQLQYRPDLAQPPPWTNVTNAVGVSNGWNQVMVSAPGQTGFFRLAQLSGPFTNSIGMPMLEIPAGTFKMGYWQSAPLDPSITNAVDWLPSTGDYDEIPSHQTTISQHFWLGSYEVSNKEYEQFDPRHALLRGKLGISTNDSEAVVFVSWEDAAAFCDWLAAREGRPYRLPTEAEWEYACRAGTTTHFSTGDTLPNTYLNNPTNIWYPIAGSPTTLYRDLTPPNPWGLHDMHGNVEEWCSDWYGPY